MHLTPKKHETKLSSLPYTAIENVHRGFEQQRYTIENRSVSAKLFTNYLDGQIVEKNNSFSIYLLVVRGIVTS